MVELTLLTYAGIGSRQISLVEAETIRGLARSLAVQGYWLHSGNAIGADQAFQEGAGKQSVAFLPWPEYNQGICPDSLRYCQFSEESVSIARKLHPKGATLSAHSFSMMARNVQMVDGVPGHPRVAFVLCCADPTEYGVKGGSAMAFRLAKLRGIPFINLRKPGWEAELRAVLGVEVDSRL